MTYSSAWRQKKTGAGRLLHMQSGFRLRAEIAQDGRGFATARSGGLRRGSDAPSHVHICMLMRSRVCDRRQATGA